MVDECIDTYRGRKRKRYGHIRRDGKRWYHHRYVWTQAHGPIPPGMFVCHKCDNPPCVNLAHLFLGTNEDNMRDKAAKGRAARKRGVASSQAKLTIEQAYECRLLWSTGVLSGDLAERYGVSSGTISRLVNGQSYR